MGMSLKWEGIQEAVEQAVQQVSVTLSYSGQDHWDTGEGSEERSFSGSVQSGEN